MYLIKTFFAAIFATLLFASCQKGVGVSTKDLVQIKFINATGKTLSNVTAEGKYIIGSLEDGSETGYINFEKFGTDTGMPDTQFAGLFGGSFRESSSKFYFCGTEKNKLKPGKYVISVRMIDLTEGEFFNLQFKQQ